MCVCVYEGERVRGNKGINEEKKKKESHHIK